MKNIGYIRNSRLTQENSVDTQTKLITDFCKTNNITLDEIIVDEGISGSGEKTDLRVQKRVSEQSMEQCEIRNIECSVDSCGINGQKETSDLRGLGGYSGHRHRAGTGFLAVQSAGARVEGLPGYSVRASLRFALSAPTVQ